MDKFTQTLFGGALLCCCLAFLPLPLLQALGASGILALFTLYFLIAYCVL